MGETPDALYQTLRERGLAIALNVSPLKGEASAKGENRSGFTFSLTRVASTREKTALADCNELVYKAGKSLWDYAR